MLINRRRKLRKTATVSHILILRNCVSDKITANTFIEHEQRL